VSKCITDVWFWCKKCKIFSGRRTRPLHTTTPHLPRGGFVTRIKTITPVISRFDQWRCAACWPRYAVSTHDKRSVRDGFSRRLRGVWFGYIVESGRKSEWCINALLSKQLLITICYTYTAAVTYTFHHCACAPCLYLLQKLEAAPPPGCRTPAASNLGPPIYFCNRWS